MRKKLIAILALVLIVLSAAFAGDSWWIGKRISGFEISGLHSIQLADVNNALYEYRGSEFTESLLSVMEKKLYAIKGVKNITTGVAPDDDAIKVVFTITEKPKLATVIINGNKSVRKVDITDSFKNLLVEGEYFDEDLSLTGSIKKSIQNLYLKKGFDSTPVDVSFTALTEKNTKNLKVDVIEGIQSRISKILFEGNNEVSEAILKKQLTLKTKGLFYRGYLDKAALANDEEAVKKYYQSLGFADVIVSHNVSEDTAVKSTEYNTVILTIKIDEGKKWLYGGVTIKGNTIFTDEQVYGTFTLAKGEVLNLSLIHQNYEALTDLYYNNGYISSQCLLNEKRDDTTMTVSYEVTIKEGPQSIIDKISINGLKKTEYHVMERELTLKSGDVFSKAKLITSAQNLYNTGLLSTIDYNLSYGSVENSVNIDFNVEEGSHKDVQFGATFGGSTSGFPVSGFLQLSDHNFRGKGQEFDVSTTLSPSKQDISLTFGDSWFKNLRWSNSVTLSFNHTKYTDVLRLGNGADYSIGNHYPYPYIAPAKEYKTSSISSLDRMKYDLWTISLAYNTGYTFIFDKGRLSLTGGVSTSINKAYYDETFWQPYNKTLSKYHEGWKFSNKVSLGVSWDGRDYKKNTTKGYIVSLNGTYAGGFLGGISNFNKLSLSGSAYFKVAEFEIKEKQKRIMFCATSTASKIFDQYFKEDGTWGWGVEASDFELLYIDGMTVGRGFNTVYGFRFMWDNMFELSMPIAENIVNAEMFVSATYGKDNILTNGGEGWYFSGGAGLKLKISGFPLGFYIVKNATNLDGNGFAWEGGTIFANSQNKTSGLKFVLAISTSLI